MPQKCETPAGTGASRNSLDRCFRDCFSPLAIQSQTLIAAYRVRPEIAATLAALVVGGGCHG